MKNCTSSQIVLTGNSINTVMINNGTINNNTINNNITLHVHSMTDLTPKIVYDLLKPVITAQIASKGINALTELIIEILLQKDGKYIYYCTDASRKAFKMLVNHEGQIVEKKDPNALCIRSILITPLSSIIGDIARVDERQSIKTLYNEVQNLKTDGKLYTAALAASLPSNSDGIPEEMRGLLEQHNQYAIQVEEDEKQKIKAMEDEKMAKIVKHLAEWITPSVRHKSDHTIYYNINDHYCFNIPQCNRNDALIQWNNMFLNKIILIGYSNSVDGRIYDFGDKELKAIKNLNFEIFLANKYGRC